MIRVCLDKKVDSKMPELTPDVLKELDRIAKMYGAKDEGFIEDLWLMLASKGRALGSRSRTKGMTEKLVKGGMKFGAAFKKVHRHYAFFSKLKKLPYFHTLTKSKDLIAAVEKLVVMFKKLAVKSQKPKCQSCSLAKNCPFGKQLQDDYTPDVQKLKGKVDDDCESPPDFQDITLNGMKFLMLIAVLSDPTTGAAALAMVKGGNAKSLLMMMVNGAGQSDAFDATFTGEQMVDALDNLVDSLSQKDLALFELARTFTETLLPHGEDDKVDVDHVSNDQRFRTMEQTSEVTKTIISDMADDDLMDKKFANGELTVRQDLERQKKKQYFEVLVDVSGSMMSRISPNMYSLHSRGSLASALVLSVLKKISEEKGILLFRFFTDHVDVLRRVDDADSLATLARIIALSNYDGGGTDVQKALLQAAQDISAEEQNGKGKAEILLITDGESFMDAKKLADAFVGADKPVLHVLDVSMNMRATSNAVKSLKPVSKTYVQVDPNNINFQDIAKGSVDK